MKGYFKALRLPAGIFFFLLVISSYNIAGKNPLEAMLPAFTTLVIYSATVVWNNWCDRNRDAISGNDFALKNEVRFLLFSKYLWLFAGLLTISLCFQEHGQDKFLIALAMFVLGIGYQMTEKIVGLPIIMVAITSAISTLFPLTNGEPYWRSILFSALVFFVMCPREIMKDFEDKERDADERFGKATLPLIIKEKKSLIVARVLLVIAAMINTALLTGTSPSNQIMSFSLVMIIATLLSMTEEHQLKRAQMTLNYGLFGAVLLGLTWPFFFHL